MTAFDQTQTLNDLDPSERLGTLIELLNIFNSKKSYTPGQTLPKFFCTGMVMVAVIGDINDWAAYKGTNDQPVSVIAKQGQKMTEHDARMYFPELEDLEYRD
jgi:hypothetical protein